MEDRGFYAFLALVLVLLCGSGFCKMQAHQQDRAQSAQCQSRGGVWISSGEGARFCARKSTVIEIG